MSANSALRSNHPTMYFQSGSFGTSKASPPTPSFRNDMFTSGSTSATAQIYGTSPTAERHPTDRNGTMPSLAASSSDPQNFCTPSVVIRKLPGDTSRDSLKSMLLFAGDIVDLDFVQSHYPDDQGFRSAVVRFQTTASAIEAKQKLNGRPNTTKEANLIVELWEPPSMQQFDHRRNTIDGTARTQTSSTSSASSAGPTTTGRSRFNSAFQPVERVSPPLTSSSSGGNGDFPYSESSTRLQSLFSPQSPLANGNGHHRVSGKSMINDDSVDDETGELLRDPVGYAKSGQQPAARRSTNPQIPVTRFGSLSLSSPNGMHFGPPSANGYASPRGNGAMQHTIPHQMSPSSASNGVPNSAYLPNYPHSQYPPVNPADQNPPCNTLYVGNLPIDTSEDELKSLFSKQRGYKRLCFRTKQNGPMCFVEFEDVSFATKALHDLYGQMLHNSVKGGIRLSFSKNPLGVRPGQTNGLGLNAAISHQAMSPGYTGVANGFSSVSGPPPGLAGPPGLANGSSYRPQNTGQDGMFAIPFPVQSVDFNAQLNPRNAYSGGIPPNMGAGMYGQEIGNGREGRNHSYSEYPLHK